ncbi:MAG: S41 family peptidase, partial [Ferruginibacter sp.]
KKYSAQILKEDFTLLRNVLQTKHPAIYWYTPKDSMDFYFDKYYNAISDSMTEREFAWNILSPAIEKIHCGHTSVSMSKGYVKYNKNKKLPAFPMFLKLWNDTAAVSGALRKDSVLKRGTIISAINNIPMKDIVNKMVDYLPEDGYAINYNYIRLSSSFPYFHRNIFGITSNYKISFIAPDGNIRDTILPVYKPPVPLKDSTKKEKIVKEKKVKRDKRKRESNKLFYRSLKVDSSGKFATMEVNSFTKGNMRRFFRKSFKQLRKENVDYLILDIRSNSGGKVGLSTMLTKYIRNTNFKVADTAYAEAQSLKPFTKYFKDKFLNNIQLFFSTHKKSDGKFHMRYYERHIYKPKTINHYNGKVYVLISGPTFSAASVFANAVKGQSNVLLAGEETGGGWHGNSGIMIPNITLPHTRTRVNIPLFRLVQFNHVPKNGQGVPPDIYIGTSYDALLRNADKKMEVVKDLILDEIKNSHIN